MKGLFFAVPIQILLSTVFFERSKLTSSRWILTPHPVLM